MKMLPLLFVCRAQPGYPTDPSRVEFLTRKSPDGRVFQAFESHEVAAAILLLHGAEEDVFLLPEDRLTPEQSQSLAGTRVLIYRTDRDYDESFGGNPRFPWEDRVVRYDPGSRKVRGVDNADDR